MAVLLAQTERVQVALYTTFWWEERRRPSKDETPPTLENCNNICNKVYFILNFDGKERSYTVDREIFAVKNFFVDDLFQQKLIFCVI